MGRPPILPLNGFTVAYMALPTILSTFAKHYYPFKPNSQDPKARDELSFDEAFALAKFVAEKASHYTVEDVQRLGNAFVPAPWSVRVIRVSIPSSTCSDAAQYLIDALGPDELQHVIGGQLWWQRRSSKDGGVEAEWIAMKSDWNRVKPRAASSSSSSHAAINSSHPDHEDHTEDRNLSPHPKAKSKQKRMSVFQQIRSSPQSAVSNPESDLTHSSDHGSDPNSNHDALQHKFPSVLSRLRSISHRIKKGNSSANSPSPVEPILGPNANPNDNPSPPNPVNSPGQTPEETPPPNHSSTPNDDFENATYEEDMDTMRCMLYIHGGAYYFGSVNTHRYSIWRYARKMGGRAFAVNYRLAPQYPFPCALVDCLAAYLYLIRPPPEAKHRPVDPSKLIIAGDSAGGGLSLALLTLIRDCGLPAPAGAVLISPWVDLTHSFPSVMENTKTDIIPPYGFMHQPSILWPPPSPDEDNSATEPQASTSNIQPEVTKPPTNLDRRFSMFRSMSKGNKTKVPEIITPQDPTTSTDVSSPEPHSHPLPSPDNTYVNPYKLTTFEDLKSSTQKGKGEKYPVVHIDGKKIEIDQQIQLYAPNDMVTHPYCSPALAPSLGGLPPLFIIAGDNEVLRDEIIYVAHRAARPDQYPLRDGLLNAHPDRKAKAALYPPTKVHLQVYDDMCHVLPMFSFARPAKYCYRAIASFCKFVTSDAKADLSLSSARSPHSSIDGIAPSANPSTAHHSNPHPASSSRDAGVSSASAHPTFSPTVVVSMQSDTPEAQPSELKSEKPTGSLTLMIPGAEASSSANACASLSTSPEGQAPSTWGRITGGSHDTHRSSVGHSGVNSEVQSIHSSISSNVMNDEGKERKAKLTVELLKELEETIYHSALPFNRPDFDDHMIRERVDVNGKIRKLEDETDLKALKLDSESIGVIQEGPVRRWAEGKEIWDHKFMKLYKKIQFQRDHHIKRATEEHKERVKERRKSALPQTGQPTQPQIEQSLLRCNSLDNLRKHERITERPPASSIAARKDTGEARKLAKALEEQVKSKGNASKLWSGLHQINSRLDSPHHEDDRRNLENDEDPIGGAGGVSGDHHHRVLQSRIRF
ncbi:arylacetamide deacetylase [Melampsora larici-populina 98AG31]|uniref:Arylacetamide deacetylase n=1 Tax=Melampsora larici-populina (strain 98AG31 / pathotype 3-4-7) TaxID=747676 RepID=F4RT73_MELLP|nr:arylacetamide deacetylase [Melampsora larici-populina 98AG31]EGG04483.1 arylacetamide deacetylase [Melampsora larici-populina 98AG31]